MSIIDFNTFKDNEVPYTLIDPSGGFVQISGLCGEYYINPSGIVLREWDSPYMGRRVKELKGHLNGGYRRIGLRRGKYDKVEFAVHRLLAQHFIPNDDPINKPYIDHRNGKKADNRLCNLRWVSHAENMYNIKMTGCVSKYQRGWIASVVMPNRVKKQKYHKTWELADQWRKDNLVQRQHEG